MASIWGELKRRNVVKVAMAYAIVAWLLLQIADVLLPALQLPEWAITLVAVLLILGFPITLLMAWAFEMTPDGIKVTSSVQPTESMTHATGLMLNFVILGLLVFAVGFLVIDRYVLEPQLRLSAATRTLPTSSSSAVRRFEIDLDTTEPLSEIGLYAHLALTPDGSTLLYSAHIDGVDRLFRRPLAGIEATPIPGTEDARVPCVSRDGQSAAFYSTVADRQLKSVRLVGDRVQPLYAQIDFSGGCSFTDNDEIVFSIRDERLLRIPAGGGDVDVVYEAPRGAYNSTRPDVLPGGAGILFSSRPVGGAARDGSVHVWVRATGEVRTLVEGAYLGRYSASGHVVFVRNGDLWAVPFDIERLERIGDEFMVLEGVQHHSGIGVGAFDIADDGTLVYVPGGDAGEELPRHLVWVDRQGHAEPIDGIDPGLFFDGALSPDGSKWATTIGNERTGFDIAIVDLARGTQTYVTRVSGNQSAPIWTPDGEFIVFRSWVGGALEAGLQVIRADGFGGPRLVYPTDWAAPTGVTPDGESLIFELEEIADLLRIPVDGPGDPVPILDTIYDEDRAAVSPNGDWIAYTSNEGGDYGIYVQSYPEMGPRYPVSDTGVEPLWSDDGSELLFRDGDAMMVVAVDYEPTFSPGDVRTLFTGSYSGPQPDCCRTYGVHPDGQRFLMIQEEPQIEPVTEARAIVVLNWFVELNELAPPSSGQ